MIPFEKVKPILKIVILFLLLAIIGVIAWKKFGPSFGGGGANPDFDAGEGADLKIPKRLQINYMPAAFESNLDEAEVMQILSNPAMYRRDFNKMIYHFNTDLLNHVANRMALPDTLKAKVETNYRERHHNYIKDLYYHDIMRLRDTSASTYEKWYESDASLAVEALHEVGAKYTCFLVNQVMTTLLETNQGTLSVKGQKVYSPCSVAMEEGLKPMVKRLEERATIEDFRNSEGILEERIERVIAELAVIEHKDKKGLTKEVATKVWGYNVSTSDIEITAISVLKVGFKLDEYFDLSTNAKTKEVVVTLPEPKILSHEVMPKVDKMDIGWLRELSNDDFNKNFNLLRREFRRDAAQRDVYNKAKKEAEKWMETIFLPMVQSINPDYKIKVRYRSNNLPDEMDMPG